MTYCIADSNFFISDSLSNPFKGILWISLALRMMAPSGQLAQVRSLAPHNFFRTPQLPQQANQLCDSLLRKGNFHQWALFAPQFVSRAHWDSN